MQRTIMAELIRWKTKRNRKPLLLKGARQVGKTWLMKEFGSKCFKNTAYLNFDSGGRVSRIFNEDYVGNDRIIDAHVKNLRKKLPGNYIKTVIGIGYQFWGEP